MNTQPVSIIVISYNCSRYTCQCIDSLLEASNGLIGEIIVVDNGSTDGTVDMIREKFKTVRILVNDRNEGYAKAVNVGVKESRGEFIIVTNADVVMGENSISFITDYLKNNPKVGVAGPQQVFPDGRWQRSYGDVPGLLCSIKNLLGITSAKHFLRTLTWPWFRWDRRPCQVGYIDGAVMAIRREAFEAVGGFDENFFFYGEDADFCMRLRKAGWKVVFHPEARVIHVRGGSSTKVCPDDRFLRLHVQSNVLLLKKHYPEWKVRLVLVLQLGYCVLRKFESYLLSLLPSKRVREFFRQRGEVFSILSGLWGEQLSQFKPTIFSRVEKK